MGNLSKFPLAAQLSAVVLPVSEEEIDMEQDKYADVKGKKFGKLTFKAPAESLNGRRAVFACECGGEKTSIVSNVKCGLVKSCGCLQPKNRMVKIKAAAPIMLKRVDPPKENAPVEKVVDLSPSPASHFSSSLRETGRDVSMLIYMASKLDLESLSALVTEIERVKFSPFASIPEGAAEEAAAALAFVKALRGA